MSLADWLTPSPPPDATPPWIVYRRDGGWYIDWNHPGWRELFRERMLQAMKLSIKLGLTKNESENP